MYSPGAQRTATVLPAPGRGWGDGHGRSGSHHHHRHERHGVQLILHTLLLWYERAQQRRRLMQLDPRLLADVGLSRSDAEEEYRKPFWQA